MTNSIIKLILVLCCINLTNVAKSNALLLANIIGCNTFACRLAAVENDVSHLKQQMNRINPSTANTYNHNPGYTPNQNQFQQGGFPTSHPQQQQQPPQQQQQQQQQQLPNQQQLNNQPTNNQQANNQAGPGNQPVQPQPPASQPNVRATNNYGSPNDDPYLTPYRRVSGYPNNQFYRRA